MRSPPPSNPFNLSAPSLSTTPHQPAVLLVLLAVSSCSQPTPLPQIPTTSSTVAPSPAHSPTAPSPTRPPWSTVPPFTPSPTVPVVALAQLSPGLYVVTSSDRGLFVYDLEGDRKGFLVEGFFGSPAFHLQTRQVADPTTSGDIQIIDLDTSTSTPIAPETWAVRLSWSPDSRMLAAETISPEQLLPSVGVVSVDTGTYTQLATSQDSAWAATDPTWSPDGAWIAFSQGSPHGASDLMLVPTECFYAPTPCVPRPHRIPTRNGSPGFYEPSWSPDSTRLVAGCSTAHPGEVDNALCVVDVGSGSITTVLHNPIEFYSPSTPIWSPDGTLIAFQESRWIYTLSPVTGQLTPVVSAPYETLEFWISVDN